MPRTSDEILAEIAVLDATLHVQNAAFTSSGISGREAETTVYGNAITQSFQQLTARKGEAFDVETGRPVSHLHLQTQGQSTSWYDFACTYVDAKWPRISAKYRRGVAEALMSITCALIADQLTEENARVVRSALFNWAFNARRRGTADQPADVTDRLAWVAGRTPPVAALAEPQTLRQVLDALATRLDGQPAAGRTTHRKRAVLTNALSYAVELGLLEENPVRSIQWKAPKSGPVAVEKQCVPNPTQARALLDAVRETRRSGPRLVAFFACLYFAALRPEEAVNLRRTWLDLPDEEGRWGWIHLAGAAPDAGRAWTDDGEQRQQRQLKHRAVGEGRFVPCPPELVTILRAHLAEFGTDGEGRLFRGIGGGELATVTYLRLWHRARSRALGTDEAATSPLARRPYDLRHAAVSTWLVSTNDPAQVAAWAGHSIDVLLKIYAKVLDGQQEQALRRIEDALSPADTPPPAPKRAPGHRARHLPRRRRQRP
jgi:integrase